MGASAGLTLRRVGGEGMLTGNCRAAAWIAACTSSAAPSMLRSRSTWIVTEVVREELCAVMAETRARVKSWLPGGAAPALARVWGPARGRLAETVWGGKPTAGNSLTGSAE